MFNRRSLKRTALQQTKSSQVRIKVSRRGQMSSRQKTQIFSDETHPTLLGRLLRKCNDRRHNLGKGYRHSAISTSRRKAFNGPTEHLPPAIYHRIWSDFMYDGPFIVARERRPLASCAVWKLSVTSPARRGRRHLVCHFSNDGGGVKR